MIIGKKTMNTISLNIANELIGILLTFISPNNNGTVKGEIRQVIITILIESDIFPLTISVNEGDETAAGIEVRRRTATASFGLKKFTVRKNRAGIMSM
jgi:hypothetical protein